MTDNEHRLEMIELKQMDLEQTVADLNEVIIRQYQLIENLQRAYEKLSGQIETMGNANPDSGSEPPPPHY